MSSCFGWLWLLLKKVCQILTISCDYNNFVYGAYNTVMFKLEMAMLTPIIIKLSSSSSLCVRATMEELQA